MPDNWGFVAAAYAVAAVILGGYWRMLARKERILTALTTGTGASARARIGTGADAAAGARDDHKSRSRQPSRPGHPRPEPGKRTSLP